jgi:hypothetical protein
MYRRIYIYGFIKIYVYLCIYLYLYINVHISICIHVSMHNLTPTNSYFISPSLCTGYRVDDQVRDLVEAKLGDDDYNDVVLLNRNHYKIYSPYVLSKYRPSQEGMTRET